MIYPLGLIPVPLLILTTAWPAEARNRSFWIVPDLLRGMSSLINRRIFQPLNSFVLRKTQIVHRSVPDFSQSLPFTRFFFWGPSTRDRVVCDRVVIREREAHCENIHVVEYVGIGALAWLACTRLFVQSSRPAAVDGEGCCVVDATGFGAARFIT